MNGPVRTGERQVDCLWASPLESSETRALFTSPASRCMENTRHVSICTVGRAVVVVAAAVLQVRVSWRSDEKQPPSACCVPACVLYRRVCFRGNTHQRPLMLGISSKRRGALPTLSDRF